VAHRVLSGGKEGAKHIGQGWNHKAFLGEAGVFWLWGQLRAALPLPLLFSVCPLLCMFDAVTAGVRGALALPCAGGLTEWAQSIHLELEHHTPTFGGHPLSPCTAFNTQTFTNMRGVFIAKSCGPCTTWQSM
jgi:hypothetical protein